jgi:hypothetical protein
MIAGIREHDTVHLMTAHNEPETQAIDHWPGEEWVAVNSVYTYSTTLYQRCRDAWEVAPTVPYFLLESAYENEHGTTPGTLRAQSYWAATSGAFGHIFGNCPIWHFGYSTSWCGLDDWEAELDEPGSINMMHYRRLFESRRWTELIPDFDHQALIAGYGTWGSSSYATAAYAADGSSILAYLPSRRQLTFDTGILGAATVRAWWYDPATGNPTEIGLLQAGTHAVTPPFEQDWVLVVDDASLDLPPPGTPIPSSAPGAGEGVGLRLQVAPNPARRGARISYRLPVPARMRLTLVSVDGRTLCTLLEGDRPAGAHELDWDGSRAGDRLDSGVYWIRLETGRDVASTRIIRLDRPR